ncbi:hypothetical protein [Streptomyces sp. NPDC048516]|uniref:hypothetical protein n=1 Tax=Streptomyces sp. NPDC048516 TaxID=3365565 RepID=UPI003722C1E1
MTLVNDARLHAEKVLALHITNRGLPAVLPIWTRSTAPDGTPMLTIRIGDEKTLRSFATEATIALDQPGDQRPALDITSVGLEVVWRTGGVWIRMWSPTQDAPRTPVPKPGPVTVPAQARPSGRLPFTTALRNRHNPKEN